MKVPNKLIGALCVSALTVGSTLPGDAIEFKEPVTQKQLTNHYADVSKCYGEIGRLHAKFDRELVFLLSNEFYRYKDKKDCTTYTLSGEAYKHYQQIYRAYYVIADLYNERGRSCKPYASAEDMAQAKQWLLEAEEAFQKATLLAEQRRAERLNTVEDTSDDASLALALAYEELNAVQM